MVAAATAASLMGSVLASAASAAPTRVAPTAVAPSSPSTASSPSPATATGTGSGLPSGSGIHSAARGPGPVGRSTPSSATGAPRSSSSAVTPAAAPSLSIAQTSCGGDTSSAAGLQSIFNARGPVWGGGDGAQPVPIDAGRTLWLFGDTYIGGGPYYGPLTTSGVVHNSMAVQYNGNCFAYLMGSDSGAWSSAIPEPNGTDWYWPDDGTFNPATGMLSIVATHVRATTGGQWGWTVLGVDVLHYWVEPTISLIDIDPLFSYSGGDQAQYGQSVMVSGDVAYLYGCAQSGTPACYAARSDLAFDADSLQYRTATGWSSSSGDAVALGIGQLSGLELHVMPVPGGYLATNQIPVLSTATNAWWSSSPLGPFVAVGSLFDESQPPLGPNPSNWFTYGGRLIQTSAGPIGVYSVNTWDAQASQVAGVYGPRFVALSTHGLDRTPFGGMDDTTTTRSGGTEVSGWAIDPDTTGPIQVRLSVDGGSSSVTTASVYRADVGAYFTADGPLHGFDTTVALPPGVHQVCAYAVNVLGGVGDTPLGCVRGTSSGPPGRFVAVTPTRILDSRDGTGGFHTPWALAQSRTLRVAGVGPVPNGATAVVVNLAVTDTSSAGFVTVAPAGGLLPIASNLNFWGGETIANLVTVAVGAGGGITLFDGSGPVDLVADVVGYYTTSGGSGYTPLPPDRLLDSRDGTGGFTTPWSPSQARSLVVAGVGGVPADATAVVVNLTVTGATLGGYVTAWPDGTAQPPTSNIDFSPGQVIANLVTVPVGASGAIDLFNRYGQVDLVADVVGYYGPESTGAMSGLGPVRILDSRDGTGGIASSWGPSQTRSLRVAGVDGVPADATSVVLNLTATDVTLGGYVTAWPAGVAQPTASNLNFVPGDTVPNLVIVEVGSNGSIDLFNRFGQVDLVADLVGYFTGP